MKSDTIAAIATAMSDSGIGIVRISGKDALSIADQMILLGGGGKRVKDMESHTIRYGHVIDSVSMEDYCEKSNGKIVDEVMVSYMKAPKSYTAEDTVEINCHGGVLMMKKILEIVLSKGARLAEPGEFTKRAFLNGRMDLSEAEAVMDLIHAKNEYALDASVKQLKGSVSNKIKSLREEILYEIAFIESALDDPEHISLEGYPERLMDKVKNLTREIEALAASFDSGKLLKEGINTVIVGKPNAGKSSLLNILVGEEKAIVTDIAGTTRDILEESVRIHGIGLNIIDTAGIHTTEDIVEKIGVGKAKEYASQADLILYIVDSSVPLDENDAQIMELIQDKKYIILLNKSDLKTVVTETQLRDRLKKDSVILRTSAKENTGIDQFEQIIKDMFFGGHIQVNDEIYITNIRHKEAVLNALESMRMVQKSLLDAMPEDFYSIDLMSAYASLGTIIGEEVGEDLVNEIFAKFCMGK